MTMNDIARPFGAASEDISIAGVPSIGPDLSRYQPYVAHLDLPEARKAEMLLAVCRIMQSFVDRAFGDDAVQRIGQVEDKRPERHENSLLPVIDLSNVALTEDDRAADESVGLNDIGEHTHQEKR